jgi:hypothetical protein
VLPRCLVASFIIRGSGDGKSVTAYQPERRSPPNKEGVGDVVAPGTPGSDVAQLAVVGIVARLAHQVDRRQPQIPSGGQQAAPQRVPGETSRIEPGYQ